MQLLHRTAAALALAALVSGAAEPAAAAEAATMPQAASYHIGPPAPDCRVLAARYGGQRLWFGAFSGTRFDSYFDIRRPHYAQGCFLSEYECRRWLHENLSFLDGGNLGWMRCQPGVPGRALY
jgi:hypothetical protein